MFTQAIKTIDESEGYLNDTEQVMCVVLLGDVLFGTCRETIGEESVKLILEHLANVKEKNNETFYERYRVIRFAIIVDWY